jgi:hypothetical protein
MNIPHPQYQLSYLNIRDFKAIEEVELEFDFHPETLTPWIFLTGRNGYGKTCVLQALAMGICGIDKNVKDLFRRGDVPPDVTCTFMKNGQETVRQIVGTDEEFVEFLLPPILPIACYGSSRLNVYERENATPNTYTASLHDTTQLLRNIELKLWDWYLMKDGALPSEEKEIARKRYEETTTLIKNLLQLDGIEIDTKKQKVFYIEKDKQGAPYQKIDRDQLAAGYKSLLALVGDIILTLSSQQPDVVSPRELAGVVIIDELELHLHPSWQKRMPTILSEAFPNVQFIASTHSPIPLLGAPKNSLFLKVNRTAEEGITVKQLKINIDNFTPNIILSSPIFGFTEVFPVTHDPRNPIHTEDTHLDMRINARIDEHTNERLKLYEGTDLGKALLDMLNEEEG